MLFRSPNSIRAAAMSITVMANWIANFIVSETFPELVHVGLDQIGPAVEHLVHRVAAIESALHVE